MRPSTGKVVVAAGLALLGWEGWTLANKHKGDTISEFLWRSMRRPLIPFALGALVAHFVWQSQDVYESFAKEDTE
jgi:hypothetical protein